MEGILFEEIANTGEACITDAQSSYRTPPSSQKDDPGLPPGPKEYLSLFGVKKVSAAEIPRTWMGQSPPNILQSDTTAESFQAAKDVTFADQSPLILQDEAAILLDPTRDELINGPAWLSEDFGVKDHRSIQDDGSSVSAESVESELSNDAVESLELTDRASWIRLMQEGNRKKYSLRDINRNRFRGSGWNDTDISGDYDPSFDSKAVLSRRFKTEKPRKVGDEADESGPKRQEHHALNYEQGRKTGQTMFVKFNFSSANELGFFRTLVGNLSSSSESAVGVNERESLRDIPGHEESTGIRTRSKPATVFNGPKGEYDHLLGHPEARGCKPCYDLGIECSLVQAGQLYPCYHCLEDENDCSLLIPPLMKRACQRCKNKRIGCSYSQDGGVGVIACENCQDSSAECVAGPAKSFRIDDILDSSGSKMSQSRSTKPKALTHSSLALNTLNKKAVKLRVPPKRQVPTTRGKNPRSIRNNKTIGSNGQEISKKKPLRSTQKKKRKTKTEPKVDGGTFLQMTTSYCHPIQFNWIPPPPLAMSSSQSPLHRHSQSESSLAPSAFPCHFCTQPGLTYGLVGLGQLRIEAIHWEYDLSLGYEELEGGWSQSGEEQTRMCTACTMARMIICLCERHVVRPILGLDPKTFDHDAAMRGLVKKMMGLEFEEELEVNEKDEKQEEVLWCSVCIFPAFYECCTRPMFSPSGLPTSPTDDIGCGLLLCEVCASRLMGTSCPTYGRHARQTPKMTSDNATVGDSVSREKFRIVPRVGIKSEVTLDTHIATSKNDYFNYPDGLRADACFLTSTGELMSRLGRPPISGPVFSQVISDDDDEGEDILDASHDMHTHNTFTSQNRRQNPLYEVRGQNVNVSKHDSESDSVISDAHQTKLKLNKNPTTMTKHDKTNPQPKLKSKRTLKSEMAQGKNAGFAGKEVDKGIKPGTWGMGSFVDLT